MFEKIGRQFGTWTELNCLDRKVLLGKLQLLSVKSNIFRIRTQLDVLEYNTMLLGYEKDLDPMLFFNPITEERKVYFPDFAGWTPNKQCCFSESHDNNQQEQPGMKTV